MKEEYYAKIRRIHLYDKLGSNEMQVTFQQLLVFLVERSSFEIYPRDLQLICIYVFECNREEKKENRATF